MAKLTDTQLIVLSAAAAREDGMAVVPQKMSKAAASKVGSSLVARKLMRELKARPGMPVWRTDEDDCGIGLMVTRAGRDAIGVEEDADTGKGTVASANKRKNEAAPPTKVTAKEVTAASSSPPREGSKQALVIGMLSKKSGATLDALVEATGWLPHTTRAALTGLRKRGFAIERSRAEGENSIYRIVGSAGA